MPSCNIYIYKRCNAIKSVTEQNKRRREESKYGCKCNETKTGRQFTIKKIQEKEINFKKLKEV